MSYLKRGLLKALLCTTALFATAGQAQSIDAVYTSFFSNKAIKGYDAVAYFTDGKPVKGDDDFSYDYLGAEWLFASQEHLDMFKANPQAYAPQYGGYCAYAIANGETASAEPDLWTIHDGKLYLNYNRKINAQWQADKEALIRKADANWPAVIKD